MFQEDEKDILPIGRMSRDSAIFRKEGDSGIMVRNLVMGKWLDGVLEYPFRTFCFSLPKNYNNVVKHFISQEI